MKKFLENIIPIIVILGCIIIPRLFPFLSTPSVPEYTVSDTVINTRTNYRMGNNCDLKGDVDVKLFFVNDDESEWTDKEIERVTQNSIMPALEFLKDEAKSYGVQLNFSVQSFFEEQQYHGIINKNLRNGGSTKDVLIQAAKHLGYNSVLAMDGDLREKNGGREVIYLTLVNKDGISFARNQIARGNIGHIEHCVIFAPFDDSTVAHEILHLFGAEDYYDGERLDVARKLYPLDIMLLETHSLSLLKVGDATAFSIGWTNEQPEVCYIEEWWQQEEE